MRCFFGKTPTKVGDGTDLTSQQRLESRLEQRNDSFKSDRDDAQASKKVKAEKDAAALESNAWREDNFKGICEEMRRREAVRREHQKISEAGKTATAVCEVSKVTVILLRAELFPDAPEPVAKTNGPSAAEV
jgi:hypothetical protein